jgi:hypothetical protein
MKIVRLIWSVGLCLVILAPSARADRACPENAGGGCQFPQTEACNKRGGICVITLFGGKIGCRCRVIGPPPLPDGGSGDGGDDGGADAGDGGGDGGADAGNGGGLPDGSSGGAPDSGLKQPPPPPPPPSPGDLTLAWVTGVAALALLIVFLLRRRR